MKTVNFRSLAVGIFGLALFPSLIGFGCDRPQAASTDANTKNAAALSSAKQSRSRVTKIVFVGKEQACDCTRKAVDAGWAALQAALGTPAKLPVELLQIDTEGAKVAPYREKRPMMALPAIYFLDGKGIVVELLQGEVSEAQIAAVLGGQ